MQQVCTYSHGNIVHFLSAQCAFRVRTVSLTQIIVFILTVGLCSLAVTLEYLAPNDVNEDAASGLAIACVMVDDSVALENGESLTFTLETRSGLGECAAIRMYSSCTLSVGVPDVCAIILPAYPSFNRKRRLYGDDSDRHRNGHAFHYLSVHSNNK